MTDTDTHMRPVAGGEEDGEREAEEYVFAAGKPRQPFRRLATAGGNREGQPTIR